MAPGSRSPGRFLPSPGPVAELFAVAVAIIALVAWYAWPAASTGGLIGAPQTDIIRAVWGLDHTWQSAPWPPFWTDRMAFPVGAKIVLLPQASMLLGAPLVGVFGPVLGFDVWVIGLWAAAGLGSAFLAWRITESAAGALLAGVVIVVQPMLFLALSDGTAEFVAWWSVPAALGAVYSSGRLMATERTARLVWGLGAGLLLGVVAIDSPYHAIFTVPFVPLVFNRMRWRRQAPMVVGLAIAGAIVLSLYVGLPLTAPNDNAPGNSISLRVWEKWETHEMARDWDYTLGTGFIPWRVVFALVGCAVLDARRAWPWLGVGALALLWGLNVHPENPQMLAQWLGEPGEVLGAAIVWFNTHVVPPVIRFPRRWLMPVAQALAVAAAIGITRVPEGWRRWGVAVVLSAGIVLHTEGLTRFRANIPHFVPPSPAFAAFISGSEAQGAVLFLPRVRSARRVTDRVDLPVFAEISRDISSADQLWLQVLCRRGSSYWPDGLRTVVRRHAFDPETDRLLHGLDDLSNPQSKGEPVPPSAVGEAERRERTVAWLVDQGLSFVAVDEQAFMEEGMIIIRATFASRTLTDQHFDDGTGVTVLVLGP